MTKKQLIAALKQFPDDTEIHIYDDEKMPPVVEIKGVDMGAHGGKPCVFLSGESEEVESPEDDDFEMEF